MSKIFVIVGPTGVGKTKLSIELAKLYNGEIINADAMQVYRGLDIGTAKVKTEEKDNIPHHLLDIKEVDEDYSIYHYQKDCRIKIDEILSRGKTPILVGGTGLYIKSALYDYKLAKNKNNNNYDEVLLDDLYQKLSELDPVGALKIDKNNRRRVVNAINYFLEHHESISNNKTNTLLYDVVFIGLTTNREKLYNIIDSRVDKMIENGLIEEAQFFYQKNIRTKPLLGGIGYKELYAYFDGDISLKMAIDLIKRNSRRYAKKQYTFFRNQMPVKWFDTNYDCFSLTVRDVCCYIDNYNKK